MSPRFGRPAQIMLPPADGAATEHLAASGDFSLQLLRGIECLIPRMYAHFNAAGPRPIHDAADARISNVVTAIVRRSTRSLPIEGGAQAPPFRELTDLAYLE